MQGKSQNCFNKYYKNGIVSTQQEVSHLLEERIKAAATLSSSNGLTNLQLKPILPGYPEIIEIKEMNGIVEAVSFLVLSQKQYVLKSNIKIHMR